MKTNSNTLEDKKDRFTPGEWKFEISKIVSEKGTIIAEGFKPFNDESFANAEHICKCVNAFPELVAALQKIADCENSAFRLDRRDALGFIKIAKEALTKVKS